MGTENNSYTPIYREDGTMIYMDDPDYPTNLGGGGATTDIIDRFVNAMQTSMANISIPSVEIPDTSQTMRDTLSALFEYSPQFAQQAWEQLQQYSGQQAQLNNELTAKYVPEELSTELSILGQFLPQFQALAQEGEASDRTATLQNIQELTPLINEIERASDPEAAKLRDLLRGTVMSELEAGSQLPYRRRHRHRFRRMPTRSAASSRSPTRTRFKSSQPDAGTCWISEARTRRFFCRNGAANQVAPPCRP